MGHWAGDLLINTLADLIKDHIRKEDGSIAARVGGDEFVLLQTKIKSYANAHLGASRIKSQYQVSVRTALGEELKKRGYEHAELTVSLMPLGVSAGVAVLRSDSLHGLDRTLLDELARNWIEVADSLMYKNKQREMSHAYSKGFEVRDKKLAETEIVAAPRLELRMS